MPIFFRLKKAVFRFFFGLHTGILAARKWRENEKMKRKWRENEEMRRKWRENEEKERLTFYISSFSLHFLPLSPFPTSIFSHFVAAC